MIIDFSILILIIGIFYYLFHCRYAFNQLVLVKKGFYKGYTGYITAKSGLYYEIKFKELKDPKYTNLDFTKGICWWNLKALDPETEKVKEDFWNSIKPKESNKVVNPLTASVKYNHATNTFDVIEHV